MRHDQIALQLYTVRRPASVDLPGTLRAVADAGYSAVELAGLPDTEPRQLAAMLADAGLRVAASHESLESLRADPGAVWDRVATVGGDRIVVPSLPEADRRTRDDVRRTAAELTSLARTASHHGIRLAYHNHAAEFERVDGTTVWDLLLEGLNPEVEIELDVYWAAYAGEDPVSRIAGLGGRVRLLHMKDLGANREDAAPGEGTLAFPEIVRAGRRAGVEWYIVEQDEPRDPVADAARGLRYLETLAESQVVAGAPA